MAYSDAQREATERYNRKTYERIELKVKKGQKDYIQKAAASVGKSVNRFILDLVAKESGIWMRAEPAKSACMRSQNRPRQPESSR